MKRLYLFAVLLFPLPLFGQIDAFPTVTETKGLEQIVTPRQVNDDASGGFGKSRYLPNSSVTQPAPQSVQQPVFRTDTPVHDPFLLVSEGQNAPSHSIPQAKPAFTPLNPAAVERTPLAETAAQEQGSAAFVPLPTFSAPQEGQEASFAKLPVKAALSVDITAKNYQLQNIDAETFEKKLLEKLGKRFVPVQNVENTPGIARFRMPVKDGTALDLSLERQKGQITVSGSAAMSESCLRIVQLLDVKEDAAQFVSEFVPVQAANLTAVKQSAQILNQQTQQQAQAAINPRVAQNIPAVTPPNVNSSVNNTADNVAGMTAAGGAVVGPVQIDIIDGLETMVIKGQPKDVEAIRAMIKQLETMSLEHEPIIELVPMKHADSYRVSQMVQQLYSQVYLARRGSLTFLPLVKPNTIMLIGKQESLDTAKELIAKLDTSVNPETQFKIFRLKNASAETLEEEITNFYNNANQQNLGLEPRVYVVSDFRTNSLIVQANPRDMEEVTALVAKLDVSGSDAMNQVKTFPLKNAVASELATTLQNAISGTGTTGGGGGGFGGGGAGANARTRGHDLVMSTIDGQGNQIRANVLYDVRVTADTRSNTLIVSAPADSMPLIEAIISQLDRLPSAEAQIKVFTLVNGDASTLATILTNMFAQTATTGGGFGGGAQGSSQIATVRPGIEEGESTLVSVRFQAETRTNSIIACGSAGDMAVVEALLIRLDEDNMNNRKVMVLKLINTKAEDIAAAVQDYATQERQLETQNSASYYPQSPAEQYRKEIIVVPELISNSLIVSTTSQYYERVKKLVKELDERQLMVGLQVLIAEVRLTGNREEGIEIGLQDSLLFDRSVLSGEENPILTPGFLFGDPATGLPVGNVNSGKVGTQGITSLGTGRVSSRSGIGGFTLAASSESVSILVRALEEQGKLRVLSRPHMTTMHNNRATVKVGQDVPYVTSLNSGSNLVGSTTSQVEYREVGTILDVTPRITPDGRIVMSVYVEKSRVGSNADGVPIGVSDGQVINSPKIDITNAQTVVSANDNETIVFAGLITEEKETVERSVPYLNKVPVVRNLFQYKSNYSVRSELLIVITPTIIRSEMDEAVIRQQEASRMHWCISDVVKMTGNSKMQIRGDYIESGDVQYIHPEPVVIDETMLPSDEKIKPLLPAPTLAPESK